ncbi:MAG TPA: phosphoribosylanthranilate isomerase, partial [Myxococcaceae bacterium]|nr:phosphoribosylanthranilate isomerase [Myxococcaceae bacterium]
VDAVGFNFWPGSKRHLPLPRAVDIASALPPGVLRVGVFVRATPEEVRVAARATGLGAVQLHGDEDPEDYAGIGVPLWQVLRIESALPAGVSPRAAALLLDARVEGFGGGGRSFDWSVAQGARRFGIPFWLAGGLSPDNVQEAVRRAAPVGVDVASGVESAPGVKDPARIRAFVAAVRAAEE